MNTYNFRSEKEQEPETKYADRGPFLCAKERGPSFRATSSRGKRGSGAVSVSLRQMPLLAYFLYYSRNYRQLNVNMGYNGHLEGVS